VVGFAPDGSVIELHGPHMILTGQTAALCAALA
jgi:hypothetical protein